MAKEIKYNISRRITSYSKRKGSFQKLLSLAKGLTEVEMKQFLDDKYPGIGMRETVEGNFEGQVGKGFIYPDYIIVKKLGGKRSKELMMWQRSGGWGIYMGAFDVFVFAYTVAEAKRLLDEAVRCRISGNDFNDYFYKCSPMGMDSQTIPTEPCVYLFNKKEKTIKKLL